jgi:ATP-binding cassette subfamily C protein
MRLSGGERQRLALARALLKNPSLLILDEATSALDGDNEREVIHTILSLKGEMTIIMITHRLSAVRNVDRIHVLHQGELLESGSWDELITPGNGIFYRMAKEQHLVE